jgi:hypothetical protein
VLEKGKLSPKPNPIMNSRLVEFLAIGEQVTDAEEGM